MDNSRITVSVSIDAKLFRDFAVFDALRVKKYWKGPAMFAAIMLAFSAACFSMYGRAEQAALLGGVLAVVGLGLPVVYFWGFMKSVNAQIQKLELSKPQYAYTVTLCDSPGGVEVAAKNGETARYEWTGLFGAFRGKGCVYLYAAQNRAFLLPDADAGESAGALRALLERNMSF